MSWLLKCSMLQGNGLSSMLSFGGPPAASWGTHFAVLAIHLHSPWHQPSPLPFGQSAHVLAVWLPQVTTCNARGTSNSGVWPSAETESLNFGYSGQLVYASRPGFPSRSWLMRMISLFVYVSKSYLLSSSTFALNISGDDITAHNENWARACNGVSVNIAPGELPSNKSASFQPFGPLYSVSCSITRAVSYTPCQSRMSAATRHISPSLRPTGAYQGCVPATECTIARPVLCSALAILAYFFKALRLPSLAQTPDLGNCCWNSPQSGSQQPSFFTKSTPHCAKVFASTSSLFMDAGKPTHVVYPLLV
mmetsp:Transcript_69097/g.200514  ORF Transcript_69097/g.200514 Transcript_69097/m.200514 type:complete len:307 (-) Transcript_69097:363-1283(-)